MRVPRNTFAKFSMTIALISAIGVSAIAKTHSDLAFSNIKIKNFGKMDDRFYRGGQPNPEDYQDLKALGIQTVIDLQDDPTSYERLKVEGLGMRYVNIPMSDSSYPKEEQINAFLRLIQEQATGKLFVHCAGGRHRTGVMGAVYRFNVNHWTYDQAYAEMKDYDFYTRFGHGDLKKYVEDYAQRMQGNSVASATGAAEKKQ